MNLLTNKTPHSFKELRRGNLVTLRAKMQFIKFWGPKCNFGKISRSKHHFGKVLGSKYKFGKSCGRNANFKNFGIEMQFFETFWD